MSWEWVAPVCTSAVGLAGIAATYYTARESRAAAARQLEEQRHAATEATLRADRLKAYSAFIQSFWDSMAKCNAAFLMGINSVKATDEEKAQALVEAQNSQGVFQANSHTVMILAESEVIKHLRAIEQLITNRFTGALGALRGAQGSFDRYHQIPPDLRSFYELYSAMKAEVGVSVDQSDLHSLALSQDPAQN
jgi:hypothetical protein